MRDSASTVRKKKGKMLFKIYICHVVAEVGLEPTRVGNEPTKLPITLLRYITEGYTLRLYSRRTAYEKSELFSITQTTPRGGTILVVHDRY